MKISVVTPSFQQAGFIRETIESVLAQGEGDWEHVVVDGGSTDGTLEILHEHDHLRWVSEEDRGQADALNKAMKLSTGELIFWINSDDVLAPGAFRAAREFFAAHSGASIVCGNAVTIDATGSVIRRSGPRVRTEHLRRPWDGSTSMHQPSLVFLRKVYDAVGPFDTGLDYAMDYDFFLRASLEFGIHHLPVDFGHFREYPGTKTGDSTVHSFREVRQCLLRHVRETGDGSVTWTAIRSWVAEAYAWVNDAVAHGERGNPREARRLLIQASLRYPPSLASRRHLYFRLRRLLGPRRYERVRRAFGERT